MRILFVIEMCSVLPERHVSRQRSTMVMSGMYGIVPQHISLQPQERKQKQRSQLPLLLPARGYQHSDIVWLIISETIAEKINIGQFVVLLKYTEWVPNRIQTCPLKIRHFTAPI